MDTLPLPGASGQRVIASPWAACLCFLCVRVSRELANSERETLSLLCKRADRGDRRRAGGYRRLCRERDGPILHAMIDGLCTCVHKPACVNKCIKIVTRTEDELASPATLCVAPGESH